MIHKNIEIKDPIKRKPTISLCMVVRDEAATIEEAIACVLPFCNEVVIGYDRRTTDKSAEIVRDLMAKSPEINFIEYEFDWNGFSAARNFAMKKCNSEWTMIWDAHEYMSPDHVEKIAGLTERNMWLVIDSDCRSIGFKLMMEDGAVGMQARLLKNGVGWKYLGKVHNQLNTPKIDPDARGMGFRDVIIEHRPTLENRKIRKKERYFQIETIMGDIYKKNPTDIRSAFYLASVAHEKAMYKKALKD